AEFTTDNDLCNGQTLNGSESCSIDVIFQPTTDGTKTATVTASANPGMDAVAMLGGTAVAPGALEIAPTTHDYGDVLVGDTSASQTFTVTNTGGATTGTIAVSLGGSNAADFTIGTDTCNGMTLAGAGMCTVDVTLTPGTAGSKNASLSVTASPGGTAPASLGGNAQAPAQITAPADHDFGTHGTGTTSSGFNLIFTNTGDVPT